ncbi:MAG: helix-turn-helix transcriptional regulator [Euryarchaeota archaeon]|nr:helix-turn-helix transcriptional regulator [Euryarchaeota archaeon]
MSLNILEEKIKKASETGGEGYHIFSNENRRNIFRELTRRACRTTSSLAASTGIDSKVVVWHLNKLKKHGFVHEWKKGRLYYYPVELIKPDDLELFRILNSKDARIIMLHASKGCIEIANIPCSKSTLYRYLKIFSDMELIEISGLRKKYLCGTEKLANLLEQYDVRGMNYKKRFLKYVEKRGFNVRIVGTINYELKIEFSGLENFTMGIYISPLRTAMEV